jgi:putative ABC transport system substrate-binding protein
MAELLSRRAFLVAVSGAFATPSAAEAQQAGKIYRIGALSSAGAEQERALQTTLRERLRERGWVEGQNVVFEWRYAEGKYERARELIDELVSLKPDVLMTRGGPVTAAAKRAVTTVPVVMWNVTDPVNIGVVASLGRPGGNITGLSDDSSPDIVGKRLQLLKEVAPTVTKVAILTRGAPSAMVPRISNYESAAAASGKALGVLLQPWRVEDAADIEKAFSAMVAEGFRALDVQSVPVTWINRRLIVELALRHRLPAIYWQREVVVDGGLMAYGEDAREVPQRLAVYLDRILKGAKPADLPVQQPTKFELLINLKTAKALGLTIPPSLLARADQVIE